MLDMANQAPPPVPATTVASHVDAATATAALSDPELPVVDELLVAGVPGPIAAAVEAVGGDAVEARLRQVTWWPGSSCTGRWDVEVTGGPLAGTRDMVVTTKSAPDGAFEVAAEDDRLAVWAVPHDPFLPGLPGALDPEVAADVVTSLGGRSGPAHTSLRAHRPTRRAVVEVTGQGSPLYFKVVAPARARRLHDRHVELSHHLPVPPSLGVDDERGIVAMDHLTAPTLRRVLEDPAATLPDPAELLTLATDFPSVEDPVEVSSPTERLPGLAGLLGVIMPAEADRLAWLLDAIGDDPVTDRRPAHGDFHEAQVLVSAGHVAGLLDVDGAGLARPADDAATMLGHLALWARLSRHPDRSQGFANTFLRHADAVLDPVDLRLRVAAVIAGLATGPFRVQQDNWPAETSWRIDLAVRWVQSAHRVAASREGVDDEGPLTDVTG